MLWSRLVAAVYSLSNAAGAYALPHSRCSETADEFRNANHVFNAIHSSMRQWGSSIFHNGMSVFPAVVPAGTQFYHGAPLENPVQDREWLAFEPEHAINFARKMKRRPPPSDTGLPQSLSVQHQDLHDFMESMPELPMPLMHAVSKDDGHTNPPDSSRPPEFEPGYLHTYRTKEATPLLYIDGMSAGKCRMGTLDTQDVLLLNSTSDHHEFWKREEERADELCKLAREKWNGKIKGFIRMEAGFEIIMCSFADSLDFIEAVRAGPLSPDGEEPGRGLRRDEVLWEWVKFVTSRYDGIGGGRVKLDYDNLVTAYSHDLDLFRAGSDLPRLENLSTVALDGLRGDIDTMMQRWDPATVFDESNKDWQSVTDMIVQRYGNFLNYFGSDASSTSEELYKELEITLRTFVNSDARNTTTEINRCVAQFNPPWEDTRRSIAARAVREITKRICETLITVFDIEMPHNDALEKLRALVQYLDWSTWKKCGECAYNEVCFIPLWPFGAVGDRENPKCRNGSDLSDRMGYWGNPRGLGSRMKLALEGLSS